MIWVLLILTALCIVFSLFAPLWVQGEANVSRPFVGGLAALSISAIIGLYALNGRPELSSIAPNADTARDNSPGNPQDAAALVASLKNRLVETASVDPEGWHLLARSQMKVAQYEEAVASYKKLVEIAPDNAAFAAEFEQAQAFITRQQIASETTPAEQQAMIQNMVSGLAERLYSDGGTPEEWARLLRAREVLGQTEARTKDIDRIKAIFKEQPDVLETLLEKD